ncbi:MAG: hypothetical protein JXM70_30860 [Pirellulales bacterium]|nr:hypothetical protein [Pirellulales bacterium]
MSLIVEHVDVWAATIPDRPGGLADKLAPLAEAGADLQFAIARRAPDKPGTGVLFVTPLQSEAETSAGAQAGFAVADSLHSLRVEGDNKSGIGVLIAKTIADAGINLRGLSAAVIGDRFTMYLALDTVDDAQKAMSLIQDVS